jgi:hypothetical protein
MSEDAYSFFEHFFFFYSLFMTVVGVVGNTFVFSIYHGSTSMRKNTLSLYFRSFSVVNSLLMLHFTRVAFLIEFNWNLVLVSDFACKTIRYSTFALSSMTSWLLVVISFDRFMNIRFPRRFAFFYHVYFQAALVSSIVLYSLVYYSPMTWNSRLVIVTSLMDNATGQVSTSAFCPNQANATIFWMDLFNSTLVPFVVMNTFSVGLVYYIRKSRARINVSSNHGKSKDRKFAITALSLNTLFFILNLPICVYNVASTYVNIDPDLDSFLLNLARVLFYTFPAIDFYVQVVVNSVVREQFFRLFNFKIIKVNGNASTATNSVTQPTNNNQTQQKSLHSTIHQH